VRSVLRHDFHSPEAQQRGSIQIVHSVHPEGRTPESGKFCTLFSTLLPKSLMAGTGGLRPVRFPGADGG
jgi:hypothetical protein